MRGDPDPEPEAVILNSLEGYTKPAEADAITQATNSSADYQMREQTCQSIMQSLNNPDLKTAKQICTSIAHLECTRMGGSGYYAVCVMLVDSNEYVYDSEAMASLWGYYLEFELNDRYKIVFKDFDKSSGTDAMDTAVEALKTKKYLGFAIVADGDEPDFELGAAEEEVKELSKEASIYERLQALHETVKDKRKEDQLDI